MSSLFGKAPKVTRNTALEASQSRQSNQAEEQASRQLAEAGAESTRSLRIGRKQLYHGATGALGVSSSKLGG